MNDKTGKQSGPADAPVDSADLTCSEGQIEDLLSEGESTETDGELVQETKKPDTGKSSSTGAPKQAQK